MTRIISTTSQVTVLAMLVSISFELAAESASPAEAASCAACHGENGVSKNPLVPTLAGQPYTLIEDNLLAFRAGKRACAPERADGSPAALLAQSMCATVAGLEDEDVVALSEFFERQEFVPATQTYDEGLVEQGREVHLKNGCEQCHSDGGRKTNAMAPVLAGQWMPYLRRAMHAVRTGSRQGPTEMNAAIRALNDSEVEPLLHFYASQGQAD